MKKLLIGCAVIALFAISGVVQANEVALVFNVNDIFMYATEDDTRLNQQGTARKIWDSPTGRYYLTYNDSSRDVGATAAQDMESVANILGWDGCWAGYQGVSHLQLWLRGPNIHLWGEQVVRDSFTVASVNGEYDWTADVSTDYVHYNTELAGEGHQNAISLDCNPAQNLWSVTGNFCTDNNVDGVCGVGDSDLIVGQQYTIWFNAANNNWRCVDAYGNDQWGSPDIEGTIIAVAIPVELVADINECAANANRHGKFVSCVAHLTNDWKKEGVITGEEKGAIMSWAAGSNIP